MAEELDSSGTWLHCSLRTLVTGRRHGCHQLSTLHGDHSAVLADYGDWERAVEDGGHVHRPKNPAG
eukprot:1160875-Pelagomonas_calceolata.AAC.3